MEFVIGGVSALMDARFAAAAGTERVVLLPWTRQTHSRPGTGPLSEATEELAETREEILKQALAVWNEIKGWVSGPEIWLAAPWPYLPLALEAYDTFDDCCGILVEAAQSPAPTVPQHSPVQIPARIPYAIDYAPGATGNMNACSAQHPPDWVVISPDSVLDMPQGSGTLRYMRVETLDEVMALQTWQELPHFAGIYLQANAPEAGTDYELWQEIIDAW